MSYISLNPDKHLGQVVGNGQCAVFVEKAANAPKDHLWKPGTLVKGNFSLQKGTAIATFQNEKYQNRINGESHAAIYIGQDATGIFVIDQWVHQPVHRRKIWFRYGAGKVCNDGINYRVIE